MVLIAIMRHVKAVINVQVNNVIEEPQITATTQQHVAKMSEHC